MTAAVSNGTSEALVDLAVSEGVAVVTMCRPPVNALVPALVDALDEAIERVGADPSARVLLVRSACPRAFCAGADIAMIESYLGRPAEMVDFVRRIQKVFGRLEDLPLPTIAELGGSTTGGGLELALACDLRLAARGVRIGLPELNIGLLPGAGGTQRLSRLAGQAVALRVILRGDLLSGDEAERLGLVQWAIDDDELTSASWELARELAARPPAAVRAVKECVRLAPTPEGFEREVSATHELLQSRDTAALIRAFLDSRRQRRNLDRPQ